MIDYNVYNCFGASRSSVFSEIQEMSEDSWQDGILGTKRLAPKELYLQTKKQTVYQKIGRMYQPDRWYGRRVHQVEREQQPPTVAS